MVAKDQQLELALGAGGPCKRGRSRRRNTQSRNWFDRMRELVDAAPDRTGLATKESDNPSQA